MHVIKLDGYNATVENGEKLELCTFDSYGEEQLQIVKAPDWENLSVIATFNPPYKKPVQAVVDSVTGVIKVPKEATADSYGVGTIVFVGLADGVQRISSDVEYIVRKHSNASGTEPAEPTPDLLQQVLTLSKDAQTAAKNAVKDAAAAKANADKAQADAEKAQQAAENAAADAAKAGPYAEAARAAQEAAESARDKAIAAQQAAENAAAAAAASKSAADTLAAEAARAALAAENSKAAANNAANLAGENATAAQQAAENAAAAANYAGQSASDAADSKAAAEIAAQAAQEAQAAAAAAKEEAVKAQVAAQTAAKSAQDAQAAAENVRDDAQTAQEGAEAARDAAAKSAEAAAKSEANAKQSADTLAESVKNVAANTAAVAELKQQVANITPDDSSIGGKPWSSRHIIDMLCPPLEESGNPVVCYPVAGYPLGVKAKWEPAQEGSGTPSPENIRPIKGRDSVQVEQCGENLLNIKLVNEIVGRPTIKNDNGWLQVDGELQGGNLWLAIGYVLRPGTYCAYFFGGDSMQDNGVLWIYGDVQALMGPKRRQAILTVKNTSKINVYLHVNRPFTLTTKLAVAIVSGSTAPTTYTPYIGQTNTLTLPETVYEGDVDAVNGEGQETWKMLTLDGTTNKFTRSGDIFWRLPFNSAPGVVSDYDTICSHFPANTFGGNQKSNYIFTTKNIMSSYFPDVNALNDYIAAQYAAGTPVQVCYKLTEPVPFTATGAQPLPALVGVNTVLTDADSTTVTGRADPIKRITDLEDAVASQT